MTTPPKVALITGITGQDGAYLAELLLQKGCEVHGIKRRSSLINTERPLRGETFVTRKITRALSRIALGLQDTLYLGNMSALRDWGHARDHVQMQWLMQQQQQQQQPEDFVIATGVQYSVRQFVQMAAEQLGPLLVFSGQGPDELATVETVKPVKGEYKARCKPGDVVVRVDPRCYRPTEVETLLGDPTRARTKLGWQPQTTVAQMVEEVVQADYDTARKDSLVRLAGLVAPDRHE